MIPLGTKAPDFTLPDTVSGEAKSLADFQPAAALVVMFICNHCPFVKHVNEELVTLASQYQLKGVNFIAISSNDVETHPDDSPEKMKEVAEELGYPFVYLYDETQEVARAYDAACTPDFFVFDKDLSLIYRGQLDDSRPDGEIPVSGADLRTALDSIITGEPVSEEQLPSMGCNIKWK